MHRGATRTTPAPREPGAKECLLTWSESHEVRAGDQPRGCTISEPQDTQMPQRSGTSLDSVGQGHAMVTGFNLAPGDNAGANRCCGRGSRGNRALLRVLP